MTIVIPTVRLALPSEAAQIAAIQRRGWHQKYPSDIRESLLTSIDLDSMTASWHSAIVSPHLASQRILVAESDGRVAGFTCIGPCPDPDADPETGGIVEFWIDPMHQRSGHGSRLMNAAIDTLRTDGFTSATWWITSKDDALRAFVESAGWAIDGAHQEIGLTDDARLKQIRLSVGF